MRGLSTPSRGLVDLTNPPFGWQRVLALAGMFLCMQWGLPQPAMAQLRSGRATRPLYQDSLAAQQRGRTEVDPAVQAASYEQVVEGALEDIEGYTSQPSSPLAYAQEPFAEEWMPGGSGCQCQQCGGDGGFVGCDSACDGLGCQSGCDDYSLLAPTAYNACPPGCGPLMQLWCRLRIRTEVPLYWRRGHGPPALVTTAPSNTPPETAGQLGDPATNILLGNAVTNEDATAGFRLRLSTWLGCDQVNELVFRVWTAGEQNDSFLFQSSQFPVLARPFLNTSVIGSPEQDTQLVAYPNQSVGDIRVDTTSAVNGLELSLKRLFFEDRFTRVDWLYGYQHVKIDEGLGIFTNTTVTDNVPPLQGARISVTDQFETHNDFHGVTYGIMSSRRFAMWNIESMFRMGAGNLRRRAMISGATTTISGGTTTTDDQGLLARRTNSRSVVDDTFIVLPEVAINLAYKIRPGFDVNLGYNYMLIPKVTRAAKLVDENLAVNLSDPLVGELDPSLQFNEEKYWLHSLGFGFQLHY